MPTAQHPAYSLTSSKNPELKSLAFLGNLSIPCAQFRKLNLKIRQWHWHSFNWWLWKLNGVVHEMTFEWEIEFCKSHSSIPNLFCFMVYSWFVWGYKSYIETRELWQFLSGILLITYVLHSNNLSLIKFKIMNEATVPIEIKWRNYKHFLCLVYTVIYW